MVEIKFKETIMSANAIQFNTLTTAWELDAQRFFNPTQAFSRKNRQFASTKESGYALTAREPETAKGRKILDDRAIGELIGFATGNGITWIQFERCTLSVNYLVKALAFKAKHGWFVDFFVNTDDHRFDANVPTPGGAWGEGRQLLAEAAELKRGAGIARVAHHSDEQVLESEAAALTERANELLFAAR